MEKKMQNQMETGFIEQSVPDATGGMVPHIEETGGKGVNCQEPKASNHECGPQYRLKDFSVVTLGAQRGSKNPNPMNHSISPVSISCSMFLSI